ncbi:hypothetical protein LV78_003332 [Actinosynnema pretiosum]|nr:hypothetical protein [Actinosynnema pretiosum]
MVRTRAEAGPLTGARLGFFRAGPQAVPLVGPLVGQRGSGWRGCCCCRSGVGPPTGDLGGLALTACPRGGIRSWRCSNTCSTRQVAGLPTAVRAQGCARTSWRRGQVPRSTTATQAALGVGAAGESTPARARHLPVRGESAGLLPWGDLRRSSTVPMRGLAPLLLSLRRGGVRAAARGGGRCAGVVRGALGVGAVGRRAADGRAADGRVAGTCVAGIRTANARVAGDRASGQRATEAQVRFVPGSCPDSGPGLGLSPGPGPGPVPGSGSGSAQVRVG